MFFKTFAEKQRETKGDCYDDDMRRLKTDNERLRDNLEHMARRLKAKDDEIKRLKRGL